MHCSHPPVRCASRLEFITFDSQIRWLGFIVLSNIMLQMTQRTWRNIRIFVALHCILGSMLVLGFTMFFSWGFTDSSTWGSWGKPQTHQEHANEFWSFYLRWYWPSICASAALTVTGILFWPRRNQSRKLQRLAEL
jgi:hypothetical protein